MNSIVIQCVQRAYITKPVLCRHWRCRSQPRRLPAAPAPCCTRCCVCPSALRGAHLHHVRPAGPVHALWCPQLQEPPFAGGQQRLNGNKCLLWHRPPPACRHGRGSGGASHCGTTVRTSTPFIAQARLGLSPLPCCVQPATQACLPSAPTRQSKVTSGLRWCRNSMSLPSPALAAGSTPNRRQGRAG